MEKKEREGMVKKKKNSSDAKILESIESMYITLTNATEDLTEIILKCPLELTTTGSEMMFVLTQEVFTGGAESQLQQY